MDKEEGAITDGRRKRAADFDGPHGSAPSNFGIAGRLEQRRSVSEYLWP
jgi:hypothetical protein